MYKYLIIYNKGKYEIGIFKSRQEAKQIAKNMHYDYDAISLIPYSQLKKNMI